MKFLLEASMVIAICIGIFKLYYNNIKGEKIKLLNLIIYCAIALLISFIIMTIFKNVFLNGYADNYPFRFKLSVYIEIACILLVDVVLGTLAYFIGAAVIVSINDITLAIKKMIQNKEKNKKNKKNERRILLQYILIFLLIILFIIRLIWAIALQF